MRTNIVLDDELLERAQCLTGIKSKRELIQKALQTLIQLLEQTEMLSLRGKINWEGDLDTLRDESIV